MVVLSIPICLIRTCVLCKIIKYSFRIINLKMPSSKPTRVQRKKSRRFLMTSKKCWVIEDHLIPLYSHLVDCYSYQLLEDPFCCEIKQEPEESLSLPSSDQHNSSHLEEVIDCFSTVRQVIFLEKFVSGCLSDEIRLNIA